MADSLTTLKDRLDAAGFVFAGSALMRGLLEQTGLRDWDSFAASWDDLGPDLYMADGGRYRRRRHAVLRAAEDRFTRLPDQPHYQSRDYNTLNGGIARWFAPILDATLESPAMRAVLSLCQAVFIPLSPPPPRAWHVELHQFRIEAKAGEAGQPTPEGLHRDGVDWVLVLLIARRNVCSGETSIHTEDKHQVGSFTLTDPMDAAWLDDRRIYHGVTAIEPVDPSRAAYRDVLVATFKG